MNMRSSLFLGATLLLCTCAADVSYLFDDSQGYGRRFDGIGGLSGGGATSKLLVNYPEQLQSDILDYLFKPGFGASLHILKVEIGGDAQSTEGTESSHMHNSWEENYNRGYEWWLMKEAKKRNPDIILAGLSWGWPAWVGKGQRTPYTDPSVPASYITKWVLGAQRAHNLTINYVGIWNEKPYNIPYIKTLRQTLDANKLGHVGIIAADEFWSIANEMFRYPVLNQSIEIIGAHYPGTYSTGTALKTGKQLWASEDYSSVNDEIGGACLARIINQNYVNGFMTSTISWNLIGSYYRGLPFDQAGLMTAQEPWSGHYQVQSPIWMAAHTAQFTAPGWQYLLHGAGVGHLERGGSYVALSSPDHKQLTIVIETMSGNVCGKPMGSGRKMQRSEAERDTPCQTHDHSACVRPALPSYDVVPQNITIVLNGSFAGIMELNVWYSRLGFNASQSIWFSKHPAIKAINGVFSLELGVDEVLTLTSVATGQKGQGTMPPNSSSFPLPYSDNFDNYAADSEPFYLTPQTGVWEVQPTGEAAHKMAARQVVLEVPIHWCPIILDFPFAVLGNHDWTDIYVEVEARLGSDNATNGFFVAARIDQGGCNSFMTRGLFLYVFPNEGRYVLSNDLAMTQSIQEGKAVTVPKSWNTLSLLVKGGSVTGAVNGDKVFSVPAPATPANGFVGLGTASFGIADFDNLNVTSAADGEILMSKHRHYYQQSTLYFEPKPHH